MIHVAPTQRNRPMYVVENRAVAVFDTLPTGCIAFMVTDAECAPMLRPGDIAVVDVSDTELEDGDLYLYEYGRGTPRARKQVQQISIGAPLRSSPDRERWFVGPYARPRTEADVKAAANAGVFTFCDGPFFDEGLDYLRRGITGRVVGILLALPAPQLRLQATRARSGGFDTENGSQLPLIAFVHAA